MVGLLEDTIKFCLLISFISILHKLNNVQIDNIDEINLREPLLPFSVRPRSLNSRIPSMGLLAGLADFPYRFRLASCLPSSPPSSPSVLAFLGSPRLGLHYCLGLVGFRFLPGLFWCFGSGVGPGFFFGMAPPSSVLLAVVAVDLLNYLHNGRQTPNI